MTNYCENQTVWVKRYRRRTQKEENESIKEIGKDVEKNIGEGGGKERGSKERGQLVLKEKEAEERYKDGNKR